MASRALSDERDQNDERAPGGVPFKVTVPLCLAGAAYVALSGQLGDFGTLVGPALEASGYTVPAAGGTLGAVFPSLRGVPGPVVAGVAAGAAGALGAAIYAYQQSQRLVQGQTTKRFLRGLDRELVQPVMEGILYRQGITLLYAPAGAGKSEFAFALVAASIRAAHDPQGWVLFCGQRVYPAKWFILSEQTRRGLLPYLQRHGLTLADTEGWIVWETWHACKARWRRQGNRGNPTWDKIAPSAIANARAHGCSGFVLDTLFQWAADTSGALNDVGGVRKTFDPLMTMAEAQMAVLVLMHTTKAGSAAGSYALKASCDVMYRLHHPPRLPDNVRELEQDKSRAEGSPKHLRIVLEDDGYRPYEDGESKGVVRPGQAPQPGPAGGPDGAPSNVRQLHLVPTKRGLRRVRPGRAPGGARRGGIEENTGAAHARTHDLGGMLEPGMAAVWGLFHENPHPVLVSDVRAVTGLDRFKINRLLGKLEADGRIKKTGEKVRNADVWQRVGE